MGFRLGVLACVSALAAGFGAHAAVNCKFAIGFGKDDLNISTPTPCPPSPAPTSVVPTVMNGTPFSAANGWSFRGLTGDFQSALTVNDDYAWVVTSPDVPSPFQPGVNYNVNDNKGFTDLDIGGMVFSMTYHAPAGGPSADDIHFLQIFSESTNGGPTTYHVDNNNSLVTPFYDQIANASVERSGNDAWFSDEPYYCENTTNCFLEGVENFSGMLRFGVYVVTDHMDPVTGAHSVKVLAGEQWGFDYSTSDFVSVAVEPQTWAMLLLGVGGVGLALRRKRQPDRGRFTERSVPGGSI